MKASYVNHLRGPEREAYLSNPPPGIDEMEHRLRNQILLRYGGEIVTPGTIERRLGLAWPTADAPARTVSSWQARRMAELDRAPVPCPRR